MSVGRYKDEYKRLMAAFTPILGDYIRIGINEVWAHGEFSHLWAEVSTEKEAMLELIETNAPYPDCPAEVMVGGWTFELNTVNSMQYFGRMSRT